ncbi:MAG: aspartate carbamoyltransferase [Defluviitaleaceae bacterium]|nr:aspartate carbamoyltransferase [Defluviitaleaceae bacterium]MCL2835473.1 aspartate carbamoyltransferase [Defluviitaleaceae bacterium]
MRHLIDPMDLTVEEIDGLLNVAGDIMKNPAKYSEACKGKKLAALFFEPSTRTRLSFEAAMLDLGGTCLGFSSADSSSATKGESVADTIRVITYYADICCIRHPKEGAATVAAKHSGIPVINAGDGGHQHPTQCLTDLLTIKSVKGRLDNLTLGLCGDLMFGRTVHSLAKAMTRYPGNHFVLISPAELKLPAYVLDRDGEIERPSQEESERLEDVIHKLDILYMTRVQKERFFNEEDYVRLKDSYILGMDKLQLAKSDLAVLHPLPRVNEISYEVDSDPRAVYFAQTNYGKYVRMALIMWMLGIKV